MSNSQSWKTWGAIIVGILVFSLFAAVWPSLSSSLNLGGAGRASAPIPLTKAPYVSHPIVINIPEVPLPNGTAVGGQSFEMAPWQAVLGLTAVILGVVGGLGVAIGIPYVRISRLTSDTAASEKYKKGSASLETKEKEWLKEARDGRKASGARPDPSMPRWSLISNTLIVLLFVYMLGMVIVANFYPEHAIVVGEELFNPTTLIAGIPALMVLTLFVFAPRWGTAVSALGLMALVAMGTFGLIQIAKQLDANISFVQTINIVGVVQLLTLAGLAYGWRSTSATDFNQAILETDKQGQVKGIPYDTIVVLFTGLLIVGLGIGVMVLINSPSWADLQQLLGL